MRGLGLLHRCLGCGPGIRVVLYVSLLIAANPAWTEPPHLSWSRTTDHPGRTATPVCLVADGSGRVELVWSSGPSENTSGASFLVLRLAPENTSAADGLVPLTSAPSLSGVLGGCAALPDGGLVVVGGSEAGGLGYFVVAADGGIAISGRLAGTTSGVIRRVIRRSNGDLVAVGSAETDTPLSVQFQLDGEVRWVSDAGWGSGVEIVDAAESAGGILVVVARGAVEGVVADGRAGSPPERGLVLAELGERGRAVGAVLLNGAGARLLTGDGGLALLLDRPEPKGRALVRIAIEPGPVAGAEEVLATDFAPVLTLEGVEHEGMLTTVSASGSLHPDLLVLEEGMPRPMLVSDPSIGAGMVWLAPVPGGVLAVSEDFVLGPGAARVTPRTQVAMIASGTRARPR